MGGIAETGNEESGPVPTPEGSLGTGVPTWARIPVSRNVQQQSRLGQGCPGFPRVVLRLGGLPPTFHSGLGHGEGQELQEPGTLTFPLAWSGGGWE